MAVEFGISLRTWPDVCERNLFDFFRGYWNRMIFPNACWCWDDRILLRKRRGNEQKVNPPLHFMWQLLFNSIVEGTSIGGRI